MNRKICHFYHITSGLGRKIKSNFGLFECQFHEIEVTGQLVLLYLDWGEMCCVKFDSRVDRRWFRNPWLVIKNHRLKSLFSSASEDSPICIFLQRLSEHKSNHPYRPKYPFHIYHMNRLNRLNFRIPITRQTDIFYTDKRRTLLNVLLNNLNLINKLVDIDVSIPYKVIKLDLLQMFSFKVSTI